MTDKTEEHLIDKSEWPDGPWKNEPDKVSWIDEDSGYHCLIKRNKYGSLCGYVGVEDNNYLFFNDYNDEKFKKIKVHGGLTYSGRQDNKDKWYFGFDCMHPCSDFIPIWDLLVNKPLRDFYDKGFINEDIHKEDICDFKDFQDGIYRDIKYVTLEIESLAHQLKKLDKYNCK